MYRNKRADHQSVYQLFRTILIATMLFAGCNAPAISAAKLTAENVKIVDCLLPGKVKKLGINRTFLSKKRPVKTSASDCEIRGGEYTQYDRASIESALAVWQGAAILGDPEAQYFVGEIFETGAGEAPNFKQALNWYRQSADQSYGPALMALGRMHESGLGVEKDLVKAMNFYREASGLTDDDIEYASVFNAVREKDLQKITTLEGALEQEKRTSGQLAKELDSLKSGLDKSDQKVRSLQQEINKKNKEIKTLGAKVSQSPLQDTRAIESELLKARRELQKQGELTAALRAQLTVTRTDGTQSDAADVASAALKESQAQLEEKSRVAEKRKTEIEKLKGRLQKLQDSLADYSPKKQIKLVQKEFKTAKKQLDSQLKNALSEVKDQKKQIAALEKKVAKSKSSSSVTEEQIKLTELELDKANRLLEAREKDAEQKERKVALLQQEIEFLKQRGKQSQTDQEASLVALKKSLSEREKLYDDQIIELGLEIDKSRETAKDLEQQLQAALDKNQSKDERIKELTNQIADAEAKMQEAEQTVAAKDQQIEEKLANIQSLNERIEQLPSQEKMEKLKVELVAQQEELALERDKAFKLNKDIDKLNKEKAGVEQRLSKVAPEEGPTIAVRWPKIAATDGMVAKVSAGSAVSIVGAVYPPKTIEHFEINGKKEELDANGMFLHVIDVGNEPIKLSLRAVDDLGKERVTTLNVEPDFSATTLLRGNGDLTVPKVKFGKFHALVIGNNDYDETKGWPALETAVNDAQEVAKLLKEKYGYKVTLKINATREDMVVALEQMRRNLTESENLLIYYAGHGYMDPENDQGYWIPVNGSTASSSGWVSNSTITEQIRATTAKNIMVIADSCYSASLTRSGIVSLRSGLSPSKKLARLKADIDSVTRMAFSSGGLQPVADSIDGSGHSVFASALLRLLRENSSVLDGSALATQVGLNVAVATRDNVQQVPQYAPLHKGGHQGGEFYFVPKS